MTSKPENFRGLHAISLLQEAEDLTLDTLIELAYDTYLPSADILILGLLEASETSSIKSEEAKEAIELLKAWDFRVSVNSVEMTLCHFYVYAYIKADKFPPTIW